jgi:cyclase
MMHDHDHDPSAVDPPYFDEVAPGVFAYIQPDGTWFINNTGFVIGADGVILIDTCSTEARTRRLLDTIRSLTDAPIRTVVNTHHHGDHTHGNYLTAPAPIIAHRRCRELLKATGIMYYEEAFIQPDWGSLQFAAPTITFESRLDLWTDDRLVELHYIGNVAHTTNDVVAWLPAERVLFTGDLVFNQGTPFLLMGPIQGSLTSLDTIRSFDARVIVPGHGPVCTTPDLDIIERYLRMIQAVAADAVDAGLSPLDAARNVDLGEFATLSDSERIVGNLHRAMAELRGPEANANMSIAAAIRDMVTFNGGRPLHCLA